MLYLVGLADPLFCPFAAALAADFTKIVPGLILSYRLQSGPSS